MLRAIMLYAVVLIIIRVHAFILNAVVLIVVRVHAFIPNVVLSEQRDIEEITSYTFSNHTWFYPSKLFRLNFLFSYFF